MNRWVVGVDFGQRNDRTAVAAMEIVPDEVTGKPFLDVRFLDRLPVGMAYPDQCARLVALVEGTPELVHADIAVDATGVGVAVSDSLREQLRRPFYELTLTSGGHATVDGRKLSVPKRDLVSRLAVAMQSRRLRLAEGLPDGPVLLAELGQFGVAITDAGNDTYGARSGHDDLVLAVSYATWLAAGLPGQQGVAWLAHLKAQAERDGVEVPRVTRNWREVSAELKAQRGLS